MAESTCVFCRIIKGELPAYKLYEDKDSLVILDINPVAKGHCLIIPTQHCPSLMDADPGLIARLIHRICHIMPALLKATNTEGFNLFQNNGHCAGQLIPHLHFHIIPRAPGDNVRFNWSPQPADKSELEKLTGRIKQQLRSSPR